MSVSELQQSAPAVRQPCFRVLANGSPLTGVVDATVTNKSHFSADTFRLCASLSGLPVAMNEQYWSDTPRDILQIDMGFLDTNGNPTYGYSFTGLVDDVDIDIEKQTLELSGRDLSGDLLDTKSAYINSDQSSSEAVAAVVRNHPGLLTGNIAKTTAWVGKIYEQNHVRLSQDQSEWDLLMFLAQQEQFDLWVSGTVLNFQPKVPLTTDPYVITSVGATANCKNLKLHRSQTLAKDIIVTVKSWNQAQGKTFSRIAKRTGANKSQRANGLAQSYFYHPPNLNQVQVDEYAKAKLAEISQHERVITFDLPGDSLLTQRSLVKLQGRQTTFDQAYFVDTISRHISMQGYEMDVRAKNHSTESTVGLS